MDPHGQTARRFPLVARHRPACLPLPDRVRALAALADQAVKRPEEGTASTVFNQSALLASDVGLPDLARTMCHRHASAYLQACPLPVMSAIRGLEPLVNLARLQIRAGHGDDGRARLLALYEAVGTGKPLAFEGSEVPGDLTRTDKDRQEVCAWLWRVVLADGTRTLTTTGRWREALAHIEQHRGIGTRMLDGRQVAVVAALTDGDTGRAQQLLNTTALGDPWEQAVTDALVVLCLNDAGRETPTLLSNLVGYCRARGASPGMTVFDTRLGLTVLDIAVSTDHPAARDLVDDLARRTTTARDGYAARELLADPLYAVIATEDQARDCRDLVYACGLDSGLLASEHSDSLVAGLNSSEEVIKASLSVTAAKDSWSTRATRRWVAAEPTSTARRDGPLTHPRPALASAAVSTTQSDRGPARDASVVVARDESGLVALLSAHFPDHEGDYLFLPGGRKEPGETDEDCARRELREEAGITARLWRPLGTYALTLDSAARIHLYEARHLTLGAQELTPTEQDFKLAWWPMDQALDAAVEGRFLLPAGPLALFLASWPERHQNAETTTVQG